MSRSSLGAASTLFEVPAKPRVVMGFRDVIRESIFGAASEDDWHPLSLRTFFTEGWDEAFAASPIGSNGAPRSSWLAVGSGVFARGVSTFFFDTNSLTTNSGLFLATFPYAPRKLPSVGPGTEYFAASTLSLPLSQRAAIVLFVPFISSNKAGPTGGYSGNFGDITGQFRLRLIEKDNFTLVFDSAFRAPTGKVVNGNGLAGISPGAEFWWNFAPKWVVRGSTNFFVVPQNHNNARVLLVTAAVGRYLTGKDAKVFKEMAVHVAATSPIATTSPLINVYVGPGLRFGLGDKWYCNLATSVPVNGPRPFGYQSLFELGRSF